MNEYFQGAAVLQKSAVLQAATGTTPASTLLKTTGKCVMVYTVVHELYLVH